MLSLPTSDMLSLPIGLMGMIDLLNIGRCVCDTLEQGGLFDNSEEGACVFLLPVGSITIICGFIKRLPAVL